MAYECAECGQSASSRLCRECALESYHGVPSDDAQATPDDGFDPAPDTDDLLVECTSCAHRYTTNGFRACPACGAYRRRYIGDLEAPPHHQTLSVGHGGP